jgi:hypothetical protein
MLTRMAVALRAMGALRLLSSPGRSATAVLTAQPFPGVGALTSLAWPARTPHVDAIPPAVGPVAVRAACTHLSHALAVGRAGAHAAFVRLALSAHGPLPATAVPSFRTTLKAAWRLPCDNRLKETLWRLAVDAVPGGRVSPWRCPGCPGLPVAVQARCHAFWDCPVAAAVLEQLRAALTAAGVAAPVTRASLWLLDAPTGVMPRVTWVVAALAALSAMDYGRRRLWAQSLQPTWVAADGPAAAVIIGRAAAARFWIHLEDFCWDVGSPTPAAFQSLSPTSPFLTLADGRVALARPAAAAAVVALAAPPSPPPSP